VQRDCKFAGAEVGAEVAADLADRVDDQLAHLLRELLQLLVGEPGEITRAIDVHQQALRVLAYGCDWSGLLVAHLL
jgi:hypothetical protein